MKLANQTAIISGASIGLGYEIAKQFIQEGANVMLCARNEAALFRAQEELAKEAADKNKVKAHATDISDLKQTENLVAKTLAAFGKIDILVANAGIHGAKGALDEIDWEEWSKAIDINLKGTALQCRAVLPHFKKQRYGKIIVLSGGGATKPMPNLSAYAASKAGIVRFAETLALEVADFNIDVNALAPGALNTRLLDDILTAGPEKVGKAYYEQALKQKSDGGASPVDAAKLCAFLASSLSDGITGKLLSAVWDPWSTLPDYIEQLKNSDIYTLRRIIPKDRDQCWGEVS